jgi:hypothetical protein
MTKRLLLASLCFALFAVTRAHAQFPVTITVNTQYWTGISPYSQQAPFYYSKLCNRTTLACNQQPSDPIARADYLNMPLGTYDAYIWHGTDYGSESVKVGTYVVDRAAVIILVAYPRPLPPNLLSCNSIGACTYPAMTPFDLLWANSQDAARTAPGWTMTYDILTSTKPGNGTWGPMLVTVADAPCNPNSAGKCRWHVDGLAALPGGAEYRWKIRAKARFNSEPYTYTTDSPTTGYAYQTP